MNTLKGPFKIVEREMRVTFYISLAITIALFALYFFLSFRVEANTSLGAMFGPFYGVFFFYPFIIAKTYKYILSMGGTRNQFFFGTVLAMLMYLVITVLVLNGLYLLSEAIFQNAFVFHMADLLHEANLPMYFWIDFLWLFILFGLGMFIQVVYFNFGTPRTLSGAGVLLLAAVAVFFFVDLTPLIEFIITEHTLFVHLLALISLVLMLLSYFLIRNAPLARGDRKLFYRAVTS